MKRGYTILEYKSIIKKMKVVRPGISITSDFIVGFPGETEEDFEQLMKLAKEVKFDNSYCFTYSERPGTPAANLVDDVPLAVKNDRLKRLVSQIDQHVLEINQSMVGKTELARTLAEFLFDSDASMVRIDMSEYMEKHSVSRLIGAPPGYVGYEEGGQFSEAVRRHPYSVVLFDEVEKAHPDVFNILLQVLDDGRITDSQGRLVDCKNTVIIMTSNIGSDRILEVSKDLSSDLDGDSRYDEMRDKVLDVLRNHFRPEFLNRIDETVIFHALRRNEIRSIAALQIKRIENRLSDRKISLKLSEEAKDYIAAVGYDPSYGARPLKRAIQREIENPIANKILEGTFAEGHQISITVEDDKLVFS
jgi:ATP-dependent Clp protease ATP-binding subunit ClpB